MSLPSFAAGVGVHLWQSTVCALAIWALLRSLLRGHEPRLRYTLWLTATVKFLVPFNALLMTGAWLGSFRPRSIAASPAIAAVVDVVGGSSVSSLLPVTSQPLVSTRVDLLPWLIAVWGCGVLVMLVRWLRDWRSAHHAARTAQIVRVEDGIEVRSSALLRERHCEPGVFGLLRPVIIVPDGIRDHLTLGQFEAVLAHERCHVRRRDNLTAALHTLVATLFWFHPMLWWIGRQLCHERERACDAAVIAAGVDRETYAESILGTCRFYLESPSLLVPGVSGGDLRKRIEAIMAGQIERRLRMAQRAVLVAAAVAALVVPAIFGALTTVVRAQAPNSFTGMATTTTRAFDVASVKVNASGDPGWRLGPPGRGGVSIVNLELRKIVASSFRIQDKMVVGPSWMDSVRYDIIGKGPETATNPEVWEMMRSLLNERFHLRYHIETREMPAYALTIARGGTKLVAGENGRCAEPIKQGILTCGDIHFLPFGVGITNMPIGGLTGGLARQLQDRPIVDKTGLTGRYDIMITWRPDDATPEQLASLPADVRPPDVNMFEAFEQQAGLAIVARREAVKVIVVDSIDRADEN